MKIAVCVKMMTGAAVDAADAFLRANRTLPSVLPAFDTHAVEEALRIRERNGGEVMLVSIGAREGLGGLRQALGMGADRAVLLSDPALTNADTAGISRVLTALLRQEAPDLTLFSPWSGDIDGALLVAMTAARLGLPALGQLRSLDIADGRASGVRQAEVGNHALSCPLPCLVEVNDSINKPRSASLKGRAQANAKPVRLMTLTDLFGDAPPVLSRTQIIDIAPAPVTRHPRVVSDKEAAAELIAMLRSHRILA